VSVHKFERPPAQAPARGYADVMPRDPRRFTVGEAVGFVLSKKSRGVERALVSVWYQGDRVTVFAPEGTGTFTAEEWERAGGPPASIR
jgi:hypothetical protein